MPLPLAGLNIIFVLLSLGGHSTINVSAIDSRDRQRGCSQWILLTEAVCALFIYYRLYATFTVKVTKLVENSTEKQKRSIFIDNNRYCSALRSLWLCRSSCSLPP